jgi:hypothetical protein
MRIWFQPSAPDGTGGRRNTPAMQVRWVRILGRPRRNRRGRACHRSFPSMLRPTGDPQGIYRTADAHPAMGEHMVVRHGCLDILVAKEDLNGPDVVAGFMQIRDEEVPQSVTGGDLHGPGSLHGPLYRPLGTWLMKVPAAIACPGCGAGPPCPGCLKAERPSGRRGSHEGRTGLAVRRSCCTLRTLHPQQRSWDPPCPSPWDPPRCVKPTATRAVLSTPNGLSRPV